MKHTTKIHNSNIGATFDQCMAHDQPKSSPLAPPVTTPTLPSRENEGSVHLKCRPHLPCTAPLGGSSPTFGYSTWTVESVQTREPPWELNPLANALS